MIIGLTGTKASGKGEVADFLGRRGFEYKSLSDVVREEAKKRGIPNYTDTDLQDIGNDLREKNGGGVLARMVMENHSPNQEYVIDGIRNPEEIRVLKDIAGNKFFLVGVDAPQDLRYTRLVERARGEYTKTREEFEKMEARDLGKGENESGQQVSACLKEADYFVWNNYEKRGWLTYFLTNSKENLVGLISEKRRLPSFKEKYKRQAYEWGLRSPCLRRKVGAMITTQDNISLSQGYNGPPRGVSHCDKRGGCERAKRNVPSGERHELCWAAHAEANAIINAGRNKASIVGGIIYVDAFPCSGCAKLIINAGIARIIFAEDYNDVLAKIMLKETEVKLERFQGVTPSGFVRFWS